MYVKTPQASVWLDADDSAKLSRPKQGRPKLSRPKLTPPPIQERPPLPGGFEGLPGAQGSTRQVLAATHPFQGCLGRYIALKRVPGSGGRDTLLVAVANTSTSESGPWWVRADIALNEHEAARWAKEGFGRLR